MAETVLNQQESKFEPGTQPPQQNINLKKIVGIVLSVIMILLTIFVLNLQNQNYNVIFKSMDMALTASDHATNNYRAYVSRYKETKVELDETTHKLEIVKGQLDQVTTELATAKDMLAKTQGLLSDAQEENSKLKKDLMGLDELQASENVQNIGELQTKIRSLKDEDSQISLQLNDLKKKLRAFDADFSNLNEGRSLISLFQSKIRLVKTRMHYLKQEAYMAKIAAQKERDRLAALNGNSGFVVRNGQAQGINGTKKSFAIDVKIEQ